MEPGLNAIRFSTPGKPRGRTRLSLLGGLRLPRLRTVALVLALALPLALGALPALADTYRVLSGVPEYYWYHGCSPTSGGMLMGYWFNKGYTQLLPGVTNAYVQSANVQNAISSPQHNAGDTYVGHTANSIADFMQTVSGGSYAHNIPTGLRNWATYVGVDTKTAYHNWVNYFGGTFDYADYKGEIDHARPMLLNLESYSPRGYWVGHTVVAYGYKDAMFNITIPIGPNDTQNVTVPGFAVMDTWKNGIYSQSNWLGVGGGVQYAILDADGREW